MTSTGLFVLEGDFWVSRGRDRIPAEPPIPPESWPPTLGTYDPGPRTTGPRPFLEDGVTPRVLQRVDGDVRITTPGFVLEDKDIYGRVIITSTATNVIIRNCIVRGPGGLDKWSSGFTAVITGSTSSLKGAWIEDTRIDCTGRENPWVDAIRESDVTLRRVEITRVIDGLSGVTRVGKVDMQGCWLHNGAYFEWVKGTVGWPGQSDARSHGDAVQIQRGSGYIIKYNTIGGFRNPGPYHSAPYTTVDAEMVAWKDAGEDFENSCLMIKQEQSTLPEDRIGTVDYSYNLLSGGASGANLSYDRENTLPGLTLVGNRFKRSTWGTQIYIIKDTAITATISGNVYEDTGLPVPISKGK
jgi:hypothetical protein